MRQRVANFLSLFTSFSTLICCALPSLLVAIGAGSAVASALSAVPWLVWFSKHKTWVFAIAGAMIALNAVLLYRPRNKLACSISGGQACDDASRWNKIALWISAAIYVFGLFAAYALLPLRHMLD
jgi:mercuric ion transport protein